MPFARVPTLLFLLVGSGLIGCGIGCLFIRKYRGKAAPTIVAGAILAAIGFLMLSQLPILDMDQQEWLAAHYKPDNILVLTDPGQIDSLIVSTDTCILKVPIKHNPKLDRPDFTYQENGTVHFLSDSPDPGLDAYKQKEKQS